MFKRLVFVGCLLILLAQAGFQLILAKTDSQTTDESVHVLAGYTYLTKGDFRFNPEHPPLVKMLSALPLLALNPNLPADFDQKWQESEDFFYDSWRENRYLGEKFFYSSGNNADTLIFWSRVPIVATTLLLGLAIFLIAWRHFGAVGAVVATGFYALDPLVTGHGHLVTTDVAFGLGALLTAYATWRFFKVPSWQQALWLGLALSLALLTKHTAVILVVAVVVIAIWVIWSKKQRLLPLLKGAGIVTGVVWLMLWAGHGFNARSLPPVQTVSEQIQQDNAKAINKTYEGTSLADREDLKLTQEELTNAGEQVSKFDRYYPRLQPFLTALPGDYLKGLFLVIGHSSGGHDSFLLGENSNTGWWYYFPLLLALKLPLATILGLIGLVYAVVRLRPKGSFVITALVIAGLFLLFAMSSKANLGLRHVFPVLPLAFVSIGWLSTAKERITKPILASLLVILSLSFATAYPSYLGYFNQIAGAKNTNYQIATDSNLDWGQDLKRIRNYINDNGLKKPIVEYGWLGTDSLNYYLGSNYRLLAKTSPRTGDTLIIGATALNRPEYQRVVGRCTELKPITNGAMACQIQ